MRHLNGKTVQVLPFAAGVEDAHGNVADGWGAAVASPGWAFDPGSTSEPRQPGQDRVIVEPTLYGPYGAVVAPRDRVTVDGVTYTVEGVRRDWENPFSGDKPGCVVSLKNVEG